MTQMTSITADLQTSSNSSHVRLSISFVIPVICVMGMSARSITVSSRKGRFRLQKACNDPSETHNQESLRRANGVFQQNLRIYGKGILQVLVRIYQ